MEANKITFKVTYTVPGEYTREVTGTVNNTEYNKYMLMSGPIKSELKPNYLTGTNEKEEPVYRWVQITYDPMIGFNSSNEQGDTTITKKYRILDNKENYDRLLESDWILDWQFLDDFDPTIKESKGISDFEEVVNKVKPSIENAFTKVKDKIVESGILDRIKNKTEEVKDLVSRISEHSTDIINYNEQVSKFKDAADINFKDVNDILLLTEIVWNKLAYEKIKIDSNGFSDKMIQEICEEFNMLPIDAKVWPIEMNLVKDIISKLSQPNNLVLDWIIRVISAAQRYNRDSFPVFISKMYGKL